MFTTRRGAACFLVRTTSTLQWWSLSRFHKMQVPGSTSIAIRPSSSSVMRGNVAFSLPMWSLSDWRCVRRVVVIALMRRRIITFAQPALFFVLLFSACLRCEQQESGHQPRICPGAHSHPPTSSRGIHYDNSLGLGILAVERSALSVSSRFIVKDHTGQKLAASAHT